MCGVCYLNGHRWLSCHYYLRFFFKNIVSLNGNRYDSNAFTWTETTNNNKNDLEAITKERPYVTDANISECYDNCDCRVCRTQLPLMFAVESFSKQTAIESVQGTWVHLWAMATKTNSNLNANKKKESQTFCWLLQFEDDRCMPSWIFFRMLLRAIVVLASRHSVCVYVCQQNSIGKICFIWKRLCARRLPFRINKTRIDI